jgi:hypothetical protein
MDNLILILIILSIVILIFVFFNRQGKKEDFLWGCQADNWNSSKNRWNGEFRSWNCSDGIDCRQGAIKDNNSRGHILADGKSYDGWINFKDTRDGKKECNVNQEY